MNTDGFIPFSLPSIGEEEINEVVATLRSGWLTPGRARPGLRVTVPERWASIRGWSPCHCTQQ